MTRVIALIPARSGSKGVIDKNIRDLGGIPLFAWSILASLNSEYIERTVVSTDSSHYASIASSYGAETPFLRPSEISLDDSTDSEFIRHAVTWLAESGDSPDLIVHLRPTTPFRNPRTIDAAIRFFTEAENASSMRSVHEMSESAYKCLELSEEGFLAPLQCVRTQEGLDYVNNSRQSFPTTYAANGYIDIVTTNAVKAGSSLYGQNCIPFLTERAYEVDTEDDFQILDHQLGLRPSIKTNIIGVK